MLKVYDLIQELSKYAPDDEVVFQTELGLLITTDNGKEIETDVRGAMDYYDISQNPKTGTVTIELRY